MILINGSTKKKKRKNLDDCFQYKNFCFVIITIHNMFFILDKKENIAIVTIGYKHNNDHKIIPQDIVDIFIILSKWEHKNV